MSPSAPTGNQTGSRALVGMEAPAVTVETHLPGGLPGFTLVGMPETAVREARDRVKSAIQNCGFDYPRGRVVVNLAPAELVKEGARFDLAIAVSILRATRQLPAAPPGSAGASLEFIGELGLFGEVRATRGCLCAALTLNQEGAQGRRLVVPAANARELGVGPGARLLLADHLSTVAAFLREPESAPLPSPPPRDPAAPDTGPDLDDVLGQHAAKRALTIAAAGGHHLLMVGPPGTGKTMLARRLSMLLPDLNADHAMEVAAAYSAAGLPTPPGARPPFRDPHHSASPPALVGGGRGALPGEVSLAHRGVLFLDELPHFKPSALDLLREPLESRVVSIARAGYRVRFPAAFQLVAAMNPCPAGRVCTEHTCRCLPEQVRRYQARVSGPLLDRIDLHVPVPPLPEQLMTATVDEAGPSADEAGRAVAAARRRQLARQGCLNADLAGRRAIEVAALSPSGRRLLERAASRFQLSARGTHRVLRAARSIADLDSAPRVDAAHLGEALGFRALNWDDGLGAAVSQRA